MSNTYGDWLQKIASECAAARDHAQELQQPEFAADLERLHREILRVHARCRQRLDERNP